MVEVNSTFSVFYSAMQFSNLRYLTEWYTFRSYIQYKYIFIDLYCSLRVYSSFEVGDCQVYMSNYALSVRLLG